MNIVPQSPSVESLELSLGGPTAGGASLMLSPVMSPWYTQQHQLIHQQAIAVLFIKHQSIYPIETHHQAF